MAYLRWSGSDWYVFAHCDGGLAVWSRFADEAPVYSHEMVQQFLSGERCLDDIPGWRQTSVSERRELLWSMRDYIADETAEDLYHIGEGNMRPTMRAMLRESSGKDRDPKPFAADVPDAD